MRFTSKEKKPQQNQNQLTDWKILQWINVTVSLISYIPVFSLSIKKLGFSSHRMIFAFQ